MNLMLRSGGTYEKNPYNERKTIEEDLNLLNKNHKFL